MSRLPIPHIINTIKTKLGFDRTMTASGDDVVDAVNKQSQQIENLGPYNGLDSNSTVAALSAAQGKKLNIDINNMFDAGYVAIQNTDFQKALSNKLKSYIEERGQIAGTAVISIKGYAYGGSVTNYPSNFSNGTFFFMAFYGLYISSNIRIINIDEFKIGTIQYNPD